ncbi:MAG TPA: hypothetical protein ENJ74_02185, partial [Nitratifractor salsuginis]|nr:hypothetical protein [Nitratifractor salsuginis]
MWKKISDYFSTSILTGGLLTALAGSAFLYLAHWGLSNRLLESLLALCFFALLLSGDRRRWFWSGFFLGLLWFHWIGISFLHYGHPWAIPFVDLAIALIYGLYFWITAVIAEWIGQRIGHWTKTPSNSSSIFHLPSSILSRRKDFSVKGFIVSLRPAKNEDLIVTLL